MPIKGNIFFWEARGLRASQKLWAILEYPEFAAQMRAANPNRPAMAVVDAIASAVMTGAAVGHIVPSLRPMAQDAPASCMLGRPVIIGQSSNNMLDCRLNGGVATTTPPLPSPKRGAFDALCRQCLHKASAIADAPALLGVYWAIAIYCYRYGEYPPVKIKPADILRLQEHHGRVVLHDL